MNANTQIQWKKSGVNFDLERSQIPEEQELFQQQVKQFKENQKNYFKINQQNYLRQSQQLTQSKDSFQQQRKEERKEEEYLLELISQSNKPLVLHVSKEDIVQVELNITDLLFNISTTQSYKQYQQAVIKERSLQNELKLLYPNSDVNRRRIKQVKSAMTVNEQILKPLQFLYDSLLYKETSLCKLFNTKPHFYTIKQRNMIIDIKKFNVTEPLKTSILYQTKDKKVQAELSQLFSFNKYRFGYDFLYTVDDYLKMRIKISLYQTIYQIQQQLIDSNSFDLKDRKQIIQFVKQFQQNYANEIDCKYYKCEQDQISIGKLCFTKDQVKILDQQVEEVNDPDDQLPKAVQQELERIENEKRNSLQEIIKQQQLELEQAKQEKLKKEKEAAELAKREKLLKQQILQRQKEQQKEQQLKWEKEVEQEEEKGKEADNNKKTDDSKITEDNKENKDSKQQQEQQEQQQPEKQDQIVEKQDQKEEVVEKKDDEKKPEQQQEENQQEEQQQKQEQQQQQEQEQQQQQVENNKQQIQQNYEEQPQFNEDAINYDKINVDQIPQQQTNNSPDDQVPIPQQLTQQPEEPIQLQQVQDQSTVIQMKVQHKDQEQDIQQIEQNDEEDSKSQNSKTSKRRKHRKTSEKQQAEEVQLNKIENPPSILPVVDQNNEQQSQDVFELKPIDCPPSIMPDINNSQEPERSRSSQSSRSSRRRHRKQ